MRFSKIIVLALCFGYTCETYAIEPNPVHILKASTIPATDTPSRARFAGTFHYTGSQQEEQSRVAAINRSVSSLFFAIRPMARSRINSSTLIRSIYSFSFDGGKPLIEAQDQPQVESTNEAGHDDGTRITVMQSPDGSRIFQIFATDEGQRENEFSLSPDNKILTLKVTVSSTRLPVPVVYSLSYQRAE